MTYHETCEFFVIDRRLTPSGVCEHVHERVHREPSDLTARKIADPWLGYAEYLPNLDLRQTPPFDDIHDGSHGLRSHQEVLRFGARG